MIVTLSALLLGAMQTAEPLRIEPHWDGAMCSTLVDGKALSPDSFPAEAKRWAQHGRPVVVIGTEEIPYRCIGGTIFALQGSGYRVREVGSPALLSMSMVTTVRFSVMPGTCAFRVNDQPVTESELAILMTSWKRYDTQVHLKPDPNAEYRCVESAMRRIERAGISNLGFVGNDQYVPDEQE